MVAPMARAALAAGAAGIMIEVHLNPQEALSDGPQSLTPEQFARLVQEIQPVIAASGRTLEKRL